MPFNPTGECTDEDRDRMLHGLYMATLTVCTTGTGNTGHLDPVGLVELNVHKKTDFTPRRYACAAAAGANSTHGFGFTFVKNPKKGLHQSRVLVLDYGRWKLKHFIHFICKSTSICCNNTL